MPHKLTSNSSVTYNAETQDSGILVIQVEQLNYETYNNNHNLLINARITSENDNTTTVGSITHFIDNSAWNTFFSAQTLSSSNEYDKQIEAALLYIKQEIGNKWGLTSSDWTYSNS